MYSLRAIILFCCLFLIFIVEFLSALQVAPQCAGQDIVCPPCNDSSVCPQCFPTPGEPNPFGQTRACCQQRSAVLALTAASIKASATAAALAQVAVDAATKVIVGVTAVASAGAFVSISQSFSLSVNPDASCNISADVAAIANAYSAACAQAAAEAEATANAVANAYAAAQSSASAASKLYAEAQAILNSTCCGFDLQVFQLSISCGQYVVNASIAANLALAVSVTAHDCAISAQVASASVNKTASKYIRASIDNCCVSGLVSKSANETAQAAHNCLSFGFELHGVIQHASNQITAYGIHNNTLESAATTIASSCTSECADFPLSCCTASKCCGNSATICTAADAITDVILSSIAITQAFVDASVAAKAKAFVFTAALANATAAVKAATYAAATIGVNVTSCCSVTVSIDTHAVANASSVASSFAAAAAAAKAVANASSHAYALSQAVARGYASSTAVVLAYGTGCCNESCCAPYRNFVNGDTFSTYDCCNTVANVVDSTSYKYNELSVDACSAAHKKVKVESFIADSTGAFDCANFIRRVTTSFKFFLNICCCTTKAPTTVTATKNAAGTIIVTAPAGLAGIPPKKSGGWFGK